MAQDTAKDITEGALVTDLLKGCEAEISNYCDQVAMGEGRLLACLYAHEDKLSGQCEYALYDAADRLERAVNAIAYVATECRSDIESHCAKVQVGEGRIAQCLKEQANEISKGCDQALVDVGLK